MSDEYNDIPQHPAYDGNSDHLPTISLIHVPHPTIPNLYQCCFEYVEPWQWSPETEMVETGRWFNGSATDGPFSTAADPRG